MKWNEGTSYPIQSGHPCIGCSEENYWDNGRLYQRASSFAGFGIESDADTLGKYALAPPELRWQVTPSWPILTNEKTSTPLQPKAKLMM